MLSLNSDLKQDSKWRICQKGCKKNESKNICFVESQLTSYSMKTILQSDTQKLFKDLECTTSPCSRDIGSCIFIEYNFEPQTKH